MTNIQFSTFLGYSDLKYNPYLLPLGPVYCATSVAQDIDNYVISRILKTEEYYKDKISFIENFISNLRKDKIEILCISALSVDFLKVKNLVNSVKIKCPELLIIIGGGLITADATFVMKEVKADFGIVGEGEFVLKQLISTIRKKEDYTSIPGLVFRKNCTVKLNKSIDINDLNSIPYPDFSLFTEFEEAIKSSKIYPILLSRSCPFKCNFCFHTSGFRYRSRNLEDILGEIIEAKEKYNINHLFFLDELFGNKKTPTLLLVKKIKELGFTYNAQTRADEVTSEKLELFKYTGCTNLSIGVESISDAVLKSMHKGITFSQIKKALNLLEVYDLDTTANIIIGDVAETKETAYKSIQWYKENKTRYNLNLGMIQCYPGTEIFEYALNKELIVKEEFLNKAEYPNDFVINITDMNDIEFDAIRREVTLIKFLNNEGKNYLFNN